MFDPARRLPGGNAGELAARSWLKPTPTLPAACLRSLRELMAERGVDLPQDLRALGPLRGPHYESLMISLARLFGLPVGRTDRHRHTGFRRYG